MKQHITIEQIKELSPQASKKLINWALEHSPQNWICRCPCKPPLMNIGQMIEFLDEQDFWDKEERKQKTGEDIKYVGIFKIGSWLVDARIVYAGREGELLNGEIGGKELCDALWEAVKEVLEK